MVDKIFYAFVVNESSINRLFSQRFVAIKLRSVVDELNINPKESNMPSSRATKAGRQSMRCETPTLEPRSLRLPLHLVLSVVLPPPPIEHPIRIAATKAPKSLFMFVIIAIYFIMKDMKPSSSGSKNEASLHIRRYGIYKYSTKITLYFVMQKNIIYFCLK